MEMLGWAHREIMNNEMLFKSSSRLQATFPKLRSYPPILAQTAIIINYNAHLFLIIINNIIFSSSTKQNI